MSNQKERDITILFKNMTKIYCNRCGEEVNPSFGFGIITKLERKDLLISGNNKKSQIFTQREAKEGHLCYSCLTHLISDFRYKL